MRARLDIEIDVLEAARKIMRRKNKTIGETFSSLGQHALTQVKDSQIRLSEEAFHGFCPFPKRGGIVTNGLIDALREKEI